MAIATCPLAEIYVAGPVEQSSKMRLAHEMTVTADAATEPQHIAEMLGPFAVIASCGIVSPLGRPSQGSASDCQYGMRPLESARHLGKALSFSPYRHKHGRAAR